MSNDPNSDRRGGDRHEARIKIRFATPEALQKEYATNISKGGLFVNTQKPRALRSHVKFNLVLPVSNESVELIGEVVHVMEPRPGLDPSMTGIGVQFIDLTPQKRAIIEAYIANIDQKNGYPVHEVAVKKKEAKKVEHPEILKDALRRVANEAQELTPEKLAELNRKIKLFYAKRANVNHYDLLGVSYTASPAAIKEAYHKQSMDFHPDRHHRRLPPDLAPQIEDIFGRINRAYKTLRDTDSRVEYDISVSNWGSVPNMPELSEKAKRDFAKRGQYKKMFPEKVLRAQEIFEEAAKALASGDKHQATVQAKIAFSFDPFNQKIAAMLKELGITIKPPEET